MKIKSITENCNYISHYESDQFADAKIELEIEMDRLVSIQSKKLLLIELKALIQGELSKFEWLICGIVYIDFVWYLNEIERQETSKIGDLDNISKPILDSLTGPSGIMIDDSQTMAFYTSWCSRRSFSTPNILNVTIKFNNDYTVTKKDLYFFQIENAIYMPCNISLQSKENLLLIKFIIKHKRKMRKLSNQGKEMGVDLDRYLIRNIWDFHRTRLKDFRSQTLTTEQIKLHADAINLTFKDALSYYRKIFKK